MIQKICPCLSWLIRKSQPTRKGYQYSPGKQLQQQQFMHKIQSQTKYTINTSDNKQLMNQQISIQQQLSHQLNLNDQPTKTNKNTNTNDTYNNTSNTAYNNTNTVLNINNNKTVSNSYEQNQFIQKQAIIQNNQYNAQQMNNKQILKQKQQYVSIKQYGFTNLGQLQLNIPQYGPDYQLLKQKSTNAANLLDISQQCTQISIPSKQKINKTKLRVWRKTSPNSFIIQYQLPCSYSFYNEYMNKKIQIKQNNKLIRQYKLIQSIYQNLGLRYLCLNKIGMLQPRQFNYLKFTNNSSTNPSGHWQLCVSKNIENQGNQTIGVKSGKLLVISYIIQDKKAQNKAGSRIRTYLNLDIGVTVDKVWERILNQSKNYIEELWEEAANQYTDQLV